MYKLIKNAIHGKRIENWRNKISAQQVNNEKNYLKCVSKPSYMSNKIIDNNLAATCKSKLALKLNKPVYIGMSILELNESINVRISL